jgi:hypothetical protein
VGEAGRGRGVGEGRGGGGVQRDGCALRGERGARGGGRQSTVERLECTLLDRSVAVRRVRDEFTFSATWLEMRGEVEGPS